MLFSSYYIQGTYYQDALLLSKLNLFLKKLLVSCWGGSAVKNLLADAGAAYSIPGWGRYPGEGDDNALQYSCLEKPTNRGTLSATVPGVTKESDMT